MTMVHTGCGGNVEEDFSKTYEYEGMTIPAYRCQKCEVEIIGDSEIELHDTDPVIESLLRAEDTEGMTENRATFEQLSEVKELMPKDHEDFYYI